ncbi:MAG: hypothetical protein ACT4QB_22765 [Gammaproteobacteria bacterium]
MKIRGFTTNWDLMRRLQFRVEHAARCVNGTAPGGGEGLHGPADEVSRDRIQLTSLKSHDEAWLPHAKRVAETARDRV